MLTDLVQIKLLGEKKRPENERFRKHMKSFDHSDRILRRIAEGIEDQIDCLQCANCCRVATAKVTERDVERLAKYLHIKPARVMADYVVKSEEEGLILQRERDRLRLSQRQRMHRLRRAPRKLPEFPPRRPRQRLHRQPHVGTNRPRLLLPHRLQLPRSVQRRNELQALAPSITSETIRWRRARSREAQDGGHRTLGTSLRSRPVQVGEPVAGWKCRWGGSGPLSRGK